MKTLLSNMQSANAETAENAEPRLHWLRVETKEERRQRSGTDIIKYHHT